MIGEYLDIYLTSQLDMNDLVASVISSWRKDGLEIRPGASKEELDAFCDRHQVQLPDDFRAFYSMVDGIGGYDMDSNLFTFYPLEHIEFAHWLVPPLANASKHGTFHPSDSERWFLFADFFVNSYAYAIDLSSDGEGRGRVILVCGTDCTMITSSFREFMELYVSAPDMVWNPW